MRETQSGFWTWTVVYHLMRKAHGDFSTVGSPAHLEDVLNQIAGCTTFLRQEALASDAADALGIRFTDLPKLNQTEAAAASTTPGQRRLASSLDNLSSLLVPDYTAA